MANISFDGADELIKSLEKADLWDDDTQEELLAAGAGVLVDSITEEMGRSGFRISHLMQKVKRSGKRKRDKNGNPYTYVTVNGKNERGERNAAVLFVLNYGRSKEYGEITGGYFWTNGANRAEQKIPDKLQEIVNEKLKERGLI